MIIQSDHLVKNPKLSLVIATYNQVQYIEQTVESALVQVCSFDYEILVADDGSNDGNREVLKQLQEKYPNRIKLIFNDKNMMVTRNYVNAIREAKGEYVATLDGDDLFLRTDVFQKYINYLDEHKDVSILHAGFTQFDNNKQETIATKLGWDSPLLHESGKQAVYDFLTQKFPFYPLGSTNCFRRKEYLEGCEKYPEIIDESWNFGEGTILNVAMLMVGKYGFINETFSQYRILNNSLSHFEGDAEKHYKFWETYLFVKIQSAISVDLDNQQIKDVFLQMENDLFRQAAVNKLYGLYGSSLTEFDRRYGGCDWYKGLLKKLKVKKFMLPLLHTAYSVKKAILH